MGHGRILTDQPTTKPKMTPIASAVMESPKVASATTGLLGMLNLYLGSLHSAGVWFFQNINYISGFVGLVLSIAIYCMQRKKLAREMEIANEEHAATMKLMRRRQTDRQ